MAPSFDTCVTFVTICEVTRRQFKFCTRAPAHQKHITADLKHKIVEDDDGGLKFEPNLKKKCELVLLLLIGFPQDFHWLVLKEAAGVDCFRHSL